MSNKSSILNDYYKYTSDYKKEYGENTVVFMQVGSFYEIYGIKENVIKDTFKVIYLQDSIIFQYEIQYDSLIKCAIEYPISI